MKDLKNKATNVAGILLLIAGAIASIATAGVALPAVVVTVGTVSGTLGAGIIAYFTGKNPDGTKKTENQLNEVEASK